MRTTEICPNVHWVGAIDSDLRDFHGYARAPRGTTYNAYLVIDDQITLFDAVASGFKEEMLERISQIVDPSRIDNIVVNHVEMDHSGCLPQVIEITKPKQVLCSRMGQNALSSHFDVSKWPLQTVADGQSIHLGSKTVEFMETKMLHWPDSMFSYIPEDSLLISSDAFGQNLATEERFDDEVDSDILMEESARYFANIILPFSPIVQKVLGGVSKRGWKPAIIAPDHGVVWRSHIDRIIESYSNWSEQKPSSKAVIVYDSMWGSTARMASAIAEGLQAEGLSVKLMSMKSYHHSDVMTEILDAGVIVVGSSTHNNGIMPLMADMMTYMKGLKPKNRIGSAFGSYGWSGESVKHLLDQLEDSKIEVACPGVKAKYVPTDFLLQDCIEMGRRLGRSLLEKVSISK